MKKLSSKKIIILDGATGTELQKLGLPHGVCPEAWCIANPDVITSVHRSYVEAGADIIYTCTFGANKCKLSEFNITDVVGTNEKLARLAKKAAGNKILVPGTRGGAGTRCVRVAGDIGPTGQFIEPFGPLAFEDAVNIFKEQVKGLLKGGVDLFVIETMIDIQEARAALIAVKELTDKFTIITMTYEKDGRTLNGTDPITALITLQSLGADAVGANCSAGPSDMIELIKKCKPYAKVPLVAKPNAGMPRLIDGKTSFDMGAISFAKASKGFIEAGAGFLGGCCGTTPEHISELKKIIGKAKPVKSAGMEIGMLSSARKRVIIEKNGPLIVAGECINPTGKKALQEELRNGKTALIREFAREQERCGAHILDVNVGTAGVDEKKTLKETVCLLSQVSDLPLVIDTSDIEAMEKALRIYPGRALINSISGEKKKIKQLLPIARKYGAMFILLPLNDKVIPEEFTGRKKILQDILKAAKVHGFTKSDIVVDGLVMTVSSNPKAAKETLKTIEWCTNVFGVPTILGLSNISFGLPKRTIVNASFLAMSIASGLRMSFLNPMDENVMNAARSSDVLMTKDKDAVRYIAKYKDQPKVNAPDAGKKAGSFEERISRCILDGNKEEIKALIEEAVKSGAEPQKLVDGTMIPAINRVGELFDRKEYFLPQLIASAEAMKIGFSVLEPYLKGAGSKDEKRTVVILATVKGDIHDIGKNIVALLLRNHGFNVIDLGKDISSDRVIKEIKKHKTPVVGLSALMTTTMVNMKEVIAKAKEEGLDARFVVGGAVVTKVYADSIGAKYASDGVDAVRVVKEIEVK